MHQDHFMANVITVGNNEAVLSTRKAILEKAGHDVVVARDLREIIAACSTGGFDVGVIGQSLPPQEKLRVSEVLLELCAGIKILEFHNGIAPDLKTPDAHLGVADSTPDDLVQSVERLARIRRRKAKASESSSAQDD
jgi:DNA-binding NtrC family response regulator